MKKIIITLVLMVSSVTVGLAADSGSHGAPQFARNGVQIRQIINRELRRKHHRNNNRETYETRIVWKGNKEYRDTYRVTWKNGNRKEKRVSHVRIN